MTTSKRPFRTAFRATAVALTTAVLVTTAGTPIAGGQSSGLIESDSLKPLGGGSGSLGSLGGSLGGQDDDEVVGPDAPPLQHIEHNIVPKDDTVVADPGTVMSVTGDVGEDQNAVITPDQDDLPEVGEHFVVDVAPGSPSGLIGRVTGVTTLPSGLVQVVTTPATVDDVYDEFSINTTVHLEDAVSTDGGAEAGPTSRMHSRSGGSMPFRVLPSYLTCEGASPGSLDIGLNLNDVSAQVVFDPRDKYLKIVMRYEQSAEVSLGINSAVDCKVPESRLPKAFLPVAGPFGLKTGPTIELEAGANTTFSAGVTASRADGVEISDQRTRAISESNYSRKEIDVTGGFDAKLFFGIKAELSANLHAAEASAGLSVGPELSASLDTENCAELSASVRLAATASASALWIFEWSVSVTLARIGYLSLIVECGSTGTTSTTRPTSTTVVPTTTVTTTPVPGFQDGAITDLTVGSGLNCDVHSPTDGRSVYYGPGACATIAYVDGQSYGTPVPASSRFDQAWTPVSQTVRGSATAADPKVITTVVRAGSTGVELTQVDFFIDGNPGYQTDITVRNTSGTAKDVKIYRAVDCYLSRSDHGTGSVYSRSVSCNANSGRRIALTDLTGGAHRQESHFSSIWNVAANGHDYDGTALSMDHDNGMGINWNRSIPRNASVVLRSRFQLDEPINAPARAQARMAPLDDSPDTKGGSAPAPTPLPTSVPTS